MDRVFKDIILLVQSRVGNDYNHPTSFPGWLEELKDLAKQNGDIKKTYYVALLVQILSKGDEELMQLIQRNSIPNKLNKFLAEKIPRDRDTTNEDSQAELRKKSAFHALLITHLHAVRPVGFKKRFLIKLMIEQDGIRWLLDLPRTDQTFLDLANFLETISPFKEILHHVCTTQRNVEKVVELALEILNKQKGLSRAKHHVVNFFEKSLIYVPFLTALGRQQGLRRLLSILSTTVSAGTSLMLLSKVEMETLRSTCRAMECYFKAQLVVKLDSIQNPSSELLDAEEDAMDKIWRQINSYYENDNAFDLNGWPFVEEFVVELGPETMVRLCQGTGSSIVDDNIQSALYILYIASLVPNACNKIALLALGSRNICQIGSRSRS